MWHEQKCFCDTVHKLKYVSQVLRPTQHKNRSFRRLSHSQSLGLVWKKLSLTQQTHTLTNQEKFTTQHKINTNKTKATFSRLEMEMAYSYFAEFHKFQISQICHLLTWTLTHLLTAPIPTRGSSSSSSSRCYWPGLTLPSSTIDSYSKRQYCHHSYDNTPRLVSAINFLVLSVNHISAPLSLSFLLMLLPHLLTLSTHHSHHPYK